MLDVPLVTSSTCLSLDGFWRSVLLYHERPHLINRKLSAAVNVLLCEIKLESQKVREIFTREALLYEIRKLSDITALNTEFIKNVAADCKSLEITKADWGDFGDRREGVYLSIRVLFPRIKSSKCLEVVIFDKKMKIVSFLAVQEFDQIMVVPKFQYHLEFNNGFLRILLNDFEDADTSSAEWLSEKLFSKLLKWSEDTKIGYIPSLSLVPGDKYCILYDQLKQKYGPELVQKWPSMATTDPKKFVYEDIAIAAYLITFWHTNKSQNINFVDCGCGNGLLVYILNQEGYKGCGLDIRSRKIWKLFEGKADLRVETVNPSSNYSEATWIIGNHSDELTPWIPVIALKSSPQTNFFLLPCCSYDFSGQKYIRKNSGISQYSDYAFYIYDISYKCGFSTLTDRLRIPSTKRSCLIGQLTSKDEDEHEKNIENINKYIEEQMHLPFSPKKTVEGVRNCTRIDKNVIERIVKVSVDAMLETKNFLVKDDGNTWNKGGSTSLRELSKIVTGEDLKILKNECGGLQTLLKNHRYLFEMRSGAVSLREPLRKTAENEKYADKPCWFVKNHPDGCLFTNETCAYKH